MQGSVNAATFGAILVGRAGISRELVDVIVREAEVSSALLESMRAQDELLKRGVDEDGIDTLVRMSNENPGRFYFLGERPCTSLSPSDVQDQTSKLAKTLENPTVGLYAAAFARTHAEFVRYAKDYKVPEADLNFFDDAVRKDFHVIKGVVHAIHACG